MCELFEIEDEFDREQMLQKLEAKALELKVKTQFNKLYRAFKKEFEKMVPQKGLRNVTHFTDQPELECGMWNASDEGIWINTEKGKLWACYHPIFPTRILVNIETQACKVELTFRVRGVWRTVLVERSVIASRSSITKLSDFGIQVTSENAGLLVQYLMDIEALNCHEIREYQSTSRLGWIGDSFMPYEADISFDNEQSLSNLFRSITTFGSRDKWYKMIEKVRSKRRIEPLIFIAASLASVLVEPCGLLPFIVDLWGETGGGKTVTLKLATSIWADPKEGAYIADAKSTIISMELKLNALNSMPLMIDDFSQIKNQYDGDFSQFIYFLTAGSGKDRATANLSLRGGTHWKNCVLVNAERSLIEESTQGGAVNRVIDVEVEKDIYPSRDVQHIVDTVHDNYGWCGAEFIDVIRELGFEEIRAIQKRYQNELSAKAERLGDHKEVKQILPVSVILTADEIAERFLFKDGIRLSINDCYRLIKGHNEVSENIRAYNMIKDSIAANLMRFDETYNCEQWGFFPDADQKVVKIFGSIFDRLMKSAGYQSKTFLSWAVKNGIAECNKNGEAKIPSRRGRQVIKCVVLHLDKLDEVTENIESDNPFL